MRVQSYSPIKKSKHYIIKIQAWYSSDFGRCEVWRKHQTRWGLFISMRLISISLSLIHSLVNGRLRMQYLRCGWIMQAVRVRSGRMGQTFGLCRWGSSQNSVTARDRAICVHWSLACSEYNSNPSDATLTLCSIYLLLVSRNQSWKCVIKLNHTLGLGQWSCSVSVLPFSFLWLQRKEETHAGNRG